MLPLPDKNADGTALPFEDQPIGNIVWNEPEPRFFDDNEEQVIEGNDGFQKDEEEDVLHFQSDEFCGCIGDIGIIRNDWNLEGKGHVSGLNVLSLRGGDAFALSFSLARNSSDELAYSFTE